MYLPEGESFFDSFCRTVRLCSFPVSDIKHMFFIIPPPAKESFGGMRLLRRADFNVGAHVNAFWRMPCRGTLDPASKKALTWDNKNITWFGGSPQLYLF